MNITFLMTTANDVINEKTHNLNKVNTQFVTRSSLRDHMSIKLHVKPQKLF